MSTESTLAVLAGTWGVAMSIAPILQIRTMVRARSSAGVSLGYLRVLFVGFVLWLAYGLALGDPALVVTNALSLAVSLATLAVAHRYRSSPRAAAERPTPPVSPAQVP